MSENIANRNICQISEFRVHGIIWHLYMNDEIEDLI